MITAFAEGFTLVKICYDDDDDDDNESQQLTFSKVNSSFSLFSLGMLAACCCVVAGLSSKELLFSFSSTEGLLRMDFNSCLGVNWE